MKTQSLSQGSIKKKLEYWESLAKQYKYHSAMATTSDSRYVYDNALRECIKQIKFFSSQLEPVYNEDEWV